MAAENNANSENENQMKLEEEISREETSSTPLVASPNEAAATEECKDADKESNPPQVVEEPSHQVIEEARKTQPCQVTEAPEEQNSSTSPIQEPVVEIVPDQNTCCHVDDDGDGSTSLSAATSSTSSSSASTSHDSNPSKDPTINNNSMSDDDDEPVWLMGVNIRPKRKRTDYQEETRGFKLFGVFIPSPCSPPPPPPSPEPVLLPLSPPNTGNKKASRFYRD